MSFLAKHAFSIALGVVLGIFGSLLLYAEWPLAALCGMALATDYGQRAWRAERGTLPALLLGLTLGSVPLWVPVAMGLTRGDLLLTLVFPCLPALMIVFGLGLQLAMSKYIKMRVRAEKRRRAA